MGFDPFRLFLEILGESFFFCLLHDHCLVSDMMCQNSIS